ncbi:kinesin-like protein Nod [Lepeophtheirus salmonis]|uniref:kinesin-like protein Nod n=1 Tax=Lepeophtheirus salmonis TaxID=72036 RepID=UPI001AE6E85C|nr:kinesin-like protein Nod [Lepeophtheirus salmonis]
MDLLSVLVRCRGASAYLQANPEENSVSLESSKGSGLFLFDGVIPADQRQGELYEAHLEPIIRESLRNEASVTVFAYGQTGTGKTYTMGTNPGSVGEEGEEKGAIPRVVHQVLEHLKSDPMQWSKTSLQVSFFEIYNEQIFDLLMGERVPLLLKEDQNHQFNILSLSSIPVESYQEVMQILVEGGETRSIGVTGSNRASSRSHAIFTLSIKCENAFFKINMVDLAGSECLKRTHATGQTLIEGLNINKSLLALGNVIESLCSKKAHIPFRDSVLTKILRECLQSSACYTVMIACVSHKEKDITDTANTLRYAYRAKRIKKQSISLKKKYVSGTPYKQNSRMWDSTIKSYYPFKTPQNSRLVNDHRSNWLSSTTIKAYPHSCLEEPPDNYIPEISNISLSSTMTSNTGFDPIFRQYNEECENTIVRHIQPLIQEIKDLRQQLGTHQKRKSKLRSPNILGIESSPEYDITLKAPSRNSRRTSRSVLKDVTNDIHVQKENVLLMSMMEKELGINPSSPILFENRKTRRQAIINDKYMEETLKSVRKSLSDKKYESSRRRSVRLQEKNLKRNSEIQHPMNVAENWSVQSQESHNENVLKILNSGNMRVLQALPAIGPKSAMVIHMYRNLNGSLESIESLKTIKGLSKSFYIKFITQNQIVL